MAPPVYTDTDGGGKTNGTRALKAETREQRDFRRRQRADRKAAKAAKRGDSNQVDIEAQAAAEVPDDGTVFPNYSYSPARPFVGAVLFFSNTMVVLFLVILVFVSPDRMSGGAAAFKNGDEYVGVLRRCTGTTCDPWMSGGTDEGGFDYANMFLTLGLASLSSLWFALFIWLFNLYRMFTSPPIPPSLSLLQGIKRFIYRAGRAFMMVNVIMTPSLIIDILVKGVKFRNAKKVDGFAAIGGGVALIFFAFLFTLLSTMIELRHPGGKTHRAVLWFNFCGALGFFTSTDTGKDDPSDDRGKKGESTEMREIK